VYLDIQGINDFTVWTLRGFAGGKAYSQITIDNLPGEMQRGCWKSMRC